MIKYFQNGTVFSQNEKNSSIVLKKIENDFILIYLRTSYLQCIYNLYKDNLKELA